MGQRSLATLVTDGRNRRRLTLMALVSIGALQLVLAVHQFQHVEPSAIGETCTICLQGERLDDADAQTSIALPVFSASVPATAENVVGLPTDPCCHYSSRAPPIV